MTVKTKFNLYQGKIRELQEEIYGKPLTQFFCEQIKSTIEEILINLLINELSGNIRLITEGGVKIFLDIREEQYPYTELDRLRRKGIYTNEISIILDQKIYELLNNSIYEVIEEELTNEENILELFKRY